METTSSFSPEEIYDEISIMFPNASCELVYHNIFELAVSTVLSAQATDDSVNRVTPILFKKYPDSKSLSEAVEEDVYKIIKTIGLAKTKSKNIINLSKVLNEKYQGVIPDSFDLLVSLPGIGRKTANVILSEGFKIPRIAVDTHVMRVANRLSLSKEVLPEKIEEDLMKIYPKEKWSDLHLKLLFFGRYFCKARNPECNKCKFNIMCKK